jgi:hypothetical protein
MILTCEFVNWTPLFTPCPKVVPKILIWKKSKISKMSENIEKILPKSEKNVQNDTINPKNEPKMIIFPK